MKTIEQHFADWESNTFGYGYGTGEEHVLRVLRLFMNCLERRHPPTWSYDYRKLEDVLTPPVAWLLINVLARDDKIEYGTSPRGAWLTESGEPLRDFLCERSLDEVIAATDQPDSYVHCMPEHCNCDDGDCRPLNPFWRNRFSERTKDESR